MDLKKMLGIFLIIIVAVFALMLTTSYAWYSYEKSSTKFDVVTADQDVDIIFQSGDYISTDVAIPIKDSDVDFYSDKYDFNIRVKKHVVGNEMVAKISLIDIVIDDEFKKIDEILGDSPFRVEFFYQGDKVGNTISGRDFTDTTYQIGDVVLSDDVDNQFELRIYLLDNGGEQKALMNKSFQAKIDVNVISRVSSSFVKFDRPDIVVSGITIDGVSSSSLPVSGFYDMKATCEKGSHVVWDALSKKLVYDKNSYVNDSCRLDFVSSQEKVYLKDVLKGSYVEYTGNFLCNGKSCNGDNAHYVNDDDMGYCEDVNYHFHTNGWRVAYIKDGTAYLVSAGALECFSGDGVKVEKIIEQLNHISLGYCNANYAYDGVCDENSAWLLKYSDIELILKSGKAYQNDLVDNGGYYWYVGDSSKDIFSWDPSLRSLDNTSFSSYGVRPIIRLSSDVLVVGGSGTYTDPYIIQK